MPKRPTSTANSFAQDWVSGAEAMRLLDSVNNWYRLHKLVMLGFVRTLALPGDPIRYHRDDCAKYRRERPVTPSRSQTVGA